MTASAHFDPDTVIAQLRPAVVALGNRVLFHHETADPADKQILLHHETVTLAGKRIALVAATGPGLQRLRDRLAQQPGLVDVFKLDRNRGAGTGPATIDRTSGAGET